MAGCDKTAGVNAQDAHGGTEWLVDATGCTPAVLRDLAALQELLGDVVRELGLSVAAEPVWKVFPGEGGITGMVLLAESHLTVHTFPERGVAAFNLYCCAPRPAWDWHGRLGAALGAGRVGVRSFPRVGLGPSAPRPRED